MPGNKLTDRLVDELAPPATGNKRVPDFEVRGFCAQVTANGERGFVLRYRIHGRERFYTIGNRRSWGCVAARNRARELRRLVDRGIDPHEQDARQRDAAITVREFWERVYAPLHVATLSASWQRNVRSMMTNDILPRLGRLPIKDVDQADVAALHRQITQRAPTRANRAKQAVSGMLVYAEKSYVLPDGERIPALRPRGSNPARDVALNREQRRERFLTPPETVRLLEILKARQRIPRDRSSAMLVKLMLLTGARFGECAKAEWSQFDFERASWRKPGHATKQRREHVMPLSPPVLALLQQLREQRAPGCPYLFPGPSGKPLTRIQYFWKSTLKQAGIEGFRLHDMRHHYASVLASGGSSLLMIGQLLGHVQAATTQRYAHLFDDVQRDAVGRAAAIITGAPIAEVVDLPKSGRR